MPRSQWTGFQDHTTDVGDGISIIENGSFQVQREVRRRPGLGDRISPGAGAVLAMGGLEVQGTGSYLICQNSTALRAVDLSSPNSSSSIYSTGSSTQGSFANINGQLYFTNGALAAVRTGSIAHAAGIAAPAATPTAAEAGAGNVDAGTRLIRYRYYNPTYNLYSNPSNAVEITTTTDQIITVGALSAIPATPSGNQIVIEATLANGSVFFQVAKVNVSTDYTYNISDLILSVQIPANAYAGPDGYGHEQAPSADVVLEHRGRSFLLNTTTGWMYWSRAGFPESFRAFDWSRKPLQGAPDKLSGAASFMGDLYIFGQRTTRRMLYTSDPAAAMMITIPGEMGVWNQRCIVQAEGRMFGWGRTGVWEVQGIQPKLISRPIDLSTRAEYDDTQYAKFHGFYDPKERVVWFMYVVSGDTYCKAAICYDLITEQWIRRRFAHSMVSSATFGDSTRQSYPYLADNDGQYVWRLNGTFDGISTLTSGTVTSAVGSTTSVLNVNESMPPSNLVGAFVYDPLDNTYHRITANTGSTITVTPSLATTPQLGAQYYIGAIDVRIVPQWTTGQDLCTHIRPPYLLIEHIGDEDVEFRVQFQVDFDSDPIALSSNLVEDRPPYGVTYLNSTTFTVTTENHHPSVPCPSTWDHAIRYDIHQIKPSGLLRILGITFQFDSGDEIDPRVRE